MKLGMIGLGRMGGNMVQRLEQDGHDVVTYTRSGGGTAATIEELVSELEAPRVAWMMVPAGDATEARQRHGAWVDDDRGALGQPAADTKNAERVAAGDPDRAQAEAAAAQADGAQFPGFVGHWTERQDTVQVVPREI